MKKILVFALALAVFLSGCTPAGTNDYQGMYREVLDRLYLEDPGLNDNIQYFGFDFSELTQLTEKEARALGDQFAEEHGMQSLYGTMEELIEQGYISWDGATAPYWEDGVLFTITETETDGNMVKFSCHKWRSGLGAIKFYNCTATFENGGFTIEYGGMAMS